MKSEHQSSSNSLRHRQMSDRVQKTLELRRNLALRNSLLPAPNQADNGDASRYADKRGTYSKALQHDPITGLVLTASYDSFQSAIVSGDSAAFEKILIGNGGDKLNGPQGGLAFYLDGLDSTQFDCPPSPTVASLRYAVELIEMYWASLLRDADVNAYAAQAVANAAVNELNSPQVLPHYAGPTDPVTRKVTPDLLFRGNFVGEGVGPYISQLLLLPANFGALSVDQMYGIVAANYGPFMTTTATYVAAQNAGASPGSLPLQAPEYLRNGRGLASYTYNDVLYQAYLIANQVLGAHNHPSNPGNPYVAWTTQKPFATFGGPDVSALIGYVAGEAIKAVWWEKWFVHLRHRPEAGGNLVHLRKSGTIAEPTPADLAVNSAAVAASHAANGSYYLSQSFPLGSPTHPAYPTGHGTVAGACITVLKFFWNGDAAIGSYTPAGVLQQLLAKTSDPLGKNLVDYPDAPPLTLNGELHKLASNISFGHGIHAGIHWRSDTVESIKLGEKVALAILQDRAQTYNEKFAVTITLVDGTPYTISNR
jgi:hypothetical protein